MTFIIMKLELCTNKSTFQVKPSLKTQYKCIPISHSVEDWSESTEGFLFREETILFLLYITLCKASESAAVHCKPWSWIWIKMFQSVLVLLCYVIHTYTVQNLHILCSGTSHQCSPLRNPCQCFPLHFGFWIQMQICLEINLGPLRTQKPSPHYKILSNYKFLFMIPYFIVQVCLIHCTTVLIKVVDKVIFKWENSRFSIKLL